MLLTPDGLSHWQGEGCDGVLAWSEVESIQLDLKTTKFKWADAVSSALIVAEAAIAQGVSETGIEPGRAVIKTRDADAAIEWALNQHGELGYWVGAVESAQAVINELIKHPEERALAKYPDHLLRVVKRTARSN